MQPRRMTEEEFGRAWRALAIRENHKPKLPETGIETAAKRREAVAQLALKGKGPREIAKALGVKYEIIANDMSKLRFAGILPRPRAAQ